MKKQKIIFIFIITFLVILLLNSRVFAENTLDDEIEISQRYLEYLELSEKEKANVIEPRMYDVSSTTLRLSNPFRLTRLLGSYIQSQYSLREIIPENMVAKSQIPTDTCWAFASLASLESYLALQDYKYGNNTMIYDFSERHMDYATSRVFLNNQINEFGFNRSAGATAVSGVPIAYLTNGLGAIAEEDMKFETNTSLIDISEIQNKNVITQVNDIIIFPSYSATDDTTGIRQQIKEHIMNYGAVTANIHGSGLYQGSNVYNSTTAALYCNDSDQYPINHAIAIIGWEDDYSVENFVEGNRPSSNGAWIAKNSYGADFGDQGFIYISYEDVNIYDELTGILDAKNEVDYENIYQYDEFGGYLKYKNNGTSKIYLATEFDKKTTGTEYLTQVSINASETYTCKVYVNPNGTSKKMTDLQQVELKAGETETFSAGYHTIEFLNPIKINGDSFVVLLEIEGTQTSYVTTLIEFNFGEFYTDSKYANVANHIYDNVTIADGKCFVAKESEFNNGEWRATSEVYETSGGKLPNYDTTIKAFTTSKVLESISITNPPTKTSYIEGQDFDATGMIVNGHLANGDIIEITDYTIQDGTELTLEQTSITISYNGFETTQLIEVVANTVESIEITTPPTKTEYWAGEDFDDAEMIVEAIYKDGTRQTITEYTIPDGLTLKNGQSAVTIEYEGKTATQDITVQLNSVEKIEIINEPNKVNYVARQNFDSEGMVVNATYKDGTSKEVVDYTIKDGNDLYAGQTLVTIEYEGKTVTQTITVVEKTAIGISIKTMPTKTAYTQSRDELDLTGGTIEISYNDDTNEEMQMTSEDITATGFNNEIVGKQTITLTYEGQTVQFDIEIQELPRPQNSHFDDVQVNILGIKAYYFTDKTQKEHEVLDVEIENIINATENEKMEYYYYLSSRQNEENITDWVQITTVQELGEKIQFEIDTLDITNYEEIVGASKTYLYVKEVATRNGMKAEATTPSLLLDVEDINIEEYLDGEKKNEVNSDSIIDSVPGEEIDNTLAPEKIPYAGKNILMILFVLAIATIGRIAYFRYNDIQIK